jgi:hypothetical protein
VRPRDAPSVRPRAGDQWTGAMATSWHQDDPLTSLRSVFRQFNMGKPVARLSGSPRRPRDRLKNISFILRRLPGTIPIRNGLSWEYYCQ